MGNRENALAASVSYPSIYSDSTQDNGPSSAPLGNSTSLWPASPPPTSTSLSSFQTFGVNDSIVKVKSYGFSGGSSLRDGNVIRRGKRNGGREGSYFSSEDGTPKRRLEELPPISPVQDFDDYYQDRFERPASPGGSERTATPTTALHPNFPNKHPDAQSSSPTAPRPPLTSGLPTPDSSNLAPHSPKSESKGRKRASLLSGLSPAQVKRISMALGEIQGKLSKGPEASITLVPEDEEETLQTRPPSENRSSPAQSASETPRHEKSSPSRLPPSPRSRNLHAHIESINPHSQAGPRLERPFPRNHVPTPILTPSRTQPARHNPSPSMHSPTSVSPMPMYIPGQPRPVGSMHRSDSSWSSRSGTPTFNGSAFNTSTSSTLSRSDSNPSPGPYNPSHPQRTSSLGRSLSAGQSSSRRDPAILHRSSMRSQSPDPTTPFAPLSSLRAGPHMFDASDYGLSSPHAIATDVLMEEEEEEEPHADEHNVKRRLPEIKLVPGRRSVAESRRESDTEGRHSSPGLGADLKPVSSTAMSSRAVWEEVSMGVSAEDSALDRVLRSPSTTLRHFASSDSTASDFASPTSPVKWNAILEPSPESQNTDLPVTPADEGAAEILRKLSGVGAHDLSDLQSRLVEKAKLEREALRGCAPQSPTLPVS